MPSRHAGSGADALAGAAGAAGPSFDCGGIEAGSVAGMVCPDPASGCDRPEAGPDLHGCPRQVRQRAAAGAQGRAARLDQGARRLLEREDKGPASPTPTGCGPPSCRPATACCCRPDRHLLCDGQPGNEVTAAFFATHPPTPIAARGDEVSLMVQQPAASGAQYQGRNETLWEHQARPRHLGLRGAPELRCRGPALRRRVLSGRTVEIVRAGREFVRAFLV